MCGILALVKKNPLSRKEIAEALASLQRIKHRGPDGEGLLLINTNTGESKSLRTIDTPEEVKCHFQELSEVPENKFNLLLGHRRLSIIDLSIQGHQPMLFDNVAITFNGEIYNYIEIREELKAKGRVFSTNSDTEVIIQAYLEWGEKCLNRFNGMWSFVLWDFNKKKFFIANDRFGVKPLYYSDVGKTQVFASEIKQFKIFKEFDNTLNNEEVFDYLKFGILDFGDNTFFNSVFRFPPSHFIYDFQLTKNNFIRFYSLPSSIKSIKLNQAYEEYNHIFTDSVNIRLRSDVKLGVAISGGVDSSAILYKTHELNKNNQKVETFSAVFPNMAGDESEHINIIEKDLFDFANFNYVYPIKEFTEQSVKDHIFHQDYPSLGGSYFAEWCVAKKVKSIGVKVILEGQGGDEVFAGYHNHFYKYCKELILRGKIFDYLNEVSSYAVLKEVSPISIHKIVIGEIKIGLALRFNLMKISNKLVSKWYSFNFLFDALKYDIRQNHLLKYLRSDDRDFMAFGIESRHPFLDYRLVDFGLSLPSNLKIKDGWQKKIVRDNMITVPKTISFRKDKKGYTTPESQWKNLLEKMKNEHHYILRNFFSNSSFNESLIPTDRLATFGYWLKINVE